MLYAHRHTHIQKHIYFPKIEKTGKMYLFYIGSIILFLRICSEIAYFGEYEKNRLSEKLANYSLYYVLQSLQSGPYNQCAGIPKGKNMKNLEIPTKEVFGKVQNSFWI